MSLEPDIYVVYIEDCVQKIIRFKHRYYYQKWIIDFLMKHQDNEDYHVDAVFEGKLEESNELLIVEE